MFEDRSPGAALKLIDFGLSKMFYKPEITVMESFVGSPDYVRRLRCPAAAVR